MNCGRLPMAIARPLVLGVIVTFAPLAQPSPAPNEGRSAQGTGGWAVHSHPCPGGNRTDALHVDDDGTLWVGCGTNGTGYGLFVSADDGESWAAASVTPASKFSQYRVSSISRGHDGALYVAGTSSISGNREMVLRVDTSIAPSPVTVVLNGVNQVGRTFHVGTYRELDDGRAIAEDLNGTNLLYRPNPSIGASANLWTGVQGAHQILSLEANDAGTVFFAGGSRINEPPRMFLPPDDPDAEPWEFETFAIPTATNWDGEIWGVAETDASVVAVGVDQDTATGKIFVSGTNPYVPGDYLELDIPDYLDPGPGIGTWARGVCANAATLVVVGERQPLTSSSGFVLISYDGGASFIDITPADVSGSVSKCHLDETRVVVAGAAGFVGIRATGDGIFRNGFEPGGN
jgi:hypothetical protein